MNKNNKYIKQIILLVSVVGMGLSVNSCATGYVADIPNYQEADRPVPPGSAYIWIDGDWNYNHSNRIYERESGRWVKEDPDRVYISGSWQSNQYGHYWVPAHWENKKHRSDRDDR